MGLSEILKKQEPQPETVAGLSGAGLGMAGTFILHSRIATYLAKIIDWFPDKEHPECYYEAVVEAREGEGKHAKIYDVCVKRFKYDDPNSYGENVVIIEITNSISDEEKAFNRILTANKENLYEAFIYNYISRKWRGFHVCREQKIITSKDEKDELNFKSDFLDINFDDNLKRYFKFINY